MYRKHLRNLLSKLTVLGSIAILLFGLVTPMTVAAETTVESNAEDQAKTIKLDPSYQHAPFDGWGTALVWFANVTGGWPDEIRNELADALFGEDGLNFNIARYNIGGQDSPETEPYMRPGGAVPGYWNRPAEFSPPDNAGDDWVEQEDWWDPTNPEHWNFNKDKNQQWWLKAAQTRGADTFEAFSNSAPYFMTQSGFTSGNWNSAEDNLQQDQYQNFATYLTRVVEHLETEMNIDISTLSPVNEPNTDYWGAKGRQEGSHWDPASQAKMINEVSKQIEALNLDVNVAAMDETNPEKFRNNWYQYDDATKANVGQMNVHTYWPGARSAVRDLAKIEDKPLWMSEVDLGPGGIPQDFDNIEPGLALSERITSDLSNLESQAWVLWQAIEDEENMNAEHENMNWGLIQVDFDPEDFSTLEWHENKKYYAMGNYSKFIRPGYQVINADDTNTLAAIDKQGKQVVVVYTNQSESAQPIDIDISGFETIGDTAAATPYVTSATDNIAEKASVKVVDESLSTTVAPKSVTTFVISDVSGVDVDAGVVKEDVAYKLVNKNSGLVLDKKEDQTSVVQENVSRNKVGQEWTFEKVTDGYSNKEMYEIVNTETGNVLTNQDGSVVLAADENLSTQRWILSTNGNEYTFINEASGTLLEVGGQSKEAGAAVSLWQANAGANQTWTIVEVGITSIELQTVWTTPGKEPVLPTSVMATYGDGETVVKPVTWDQIAKESYEAEGQFVVEGSVEGASVKAKATVYVSEIATIQESKVKTIPGKRPNLPETVVAQLHVGAHVTVPVTWEDIDQKLYEDTNKFTVNGSVKGTGVKAVAHVQVLEAGIENLALNTGSEFPKASASFTGEWDHVNNLNDGVKEGSARWTNWDPNSWRENDWVQIDLGEEKEITEVKFTFYDDNGGTRPPESVNLEYWNGSEWIAIPNTELNVEGEDEAVINMTPLTTSMVRANLTAMADACIAIREIELMGIGDTPSLGSNALLDDILINGESLQGFESEKLAYDMELEADATVPSVEVVTHDLFASYELVLPTSLPGKAMINVTSEDEKATKTYEVNFTKAKEEEQPPGDGDGTPGDENEPPGEEQPPGDGEEPPGDGNEPPKDGDETPDEGDETPGEEAPSKEITVELGETIEVHAGTVISINGSNSKITLPDDLPEGTTLLIKKVSADPDGLKQAGDVYDFVFTYPGDDSYHGTFSLSLDYDQESFNSEDVSIYYLNEANDNWEKQGGSAKDGNVTLEVSHFSTYGVFAADVDKSTADSNSNDDEEQPLPDTATNTFNFLLVGLVLLLVGGISMWVVRRKFKS
ncbi:glycoside hydrolase [Aquibacillus kalidii]|uniref:glycoside hydrolase n=1 Tax=Aquibacillus kalidii TaxID=2762597 RepID=UPI0016463A40|nr:glycoside hydrolase [Aquibacillus kalidii]